MFVVAEKHAGSHRSDVPCYTAFSDMWHGHFSDISLKVQKSVSGKDKVAMILKNLINKCQLRNNATEMQHLKTCLLRWRLSMRRERLFYYRYRIRAAQDPYAALSMITDGATQE